MATSLVSTGVQFPDATIQTTAAAGTPGATAQYSMVGPSSLGSGMALAFNVSDLASGSLNTSFMGLYASGSGTQRSILSPFWSSYYSCWFGLLATTAASVYGVGISKNGFDWRPISVNLGTALGGVTLTPNGQSGMPVIAVDDSNGRIFVMYYTAPSIIVAYSSLTSTQSLSGGWTTALTATASRIGGLMYCKMSTTAASGIVAVYNNGSNVLYIDTCTAGTTTFTNRITQSLPSSEVGWASYQENGPIVVPVANRTYASYTLSGDITTGWTTNSALPANPTDSRQSCVANGYMVYIGGGAGSFYWSTNGTTWTIQSTGGAALNGIFYTGSVWVAWDANATYISSTNAPNSTWSMYSGGANANRFIGMNSQNWARRVTAT